MPVTAVPGDPGLIEDLFNAVDFDEPGIVVELLNRGMLLDSALDGYSLLARAASVRNEAMALMLLDRGAVFSSGPFGPMGNSILHLSAWSARLTCEFLRRGADVSMLNVDGHPPLFHAVTMRCPEAVRLLLDAGADVAARSLFNGRPHKTALHCAANALDPEMVSLLLVARVPTVRNAHAQTPLHLAAVGGVGAAPETFIAVVRLLTAAGIDVDGRDEDGESALFYTARAGLPERVRALLTIGADRSLRCASDATLDDVAREGAANDVLAVLQSWDAAQALRRQVVSW